ncbi:hypothetical protein CTAYLR_001427 [Chrysophaeum taylorii]|uniref:Myosin motor domain-containing protein n=1 Tax=Chrysophaeum taylorii TaxID=2483200 RepID=A0AAD7U9P9_9STRA|nr:hypothetical protein CTAYLR_001427 [Chrysophaeum taylorii]
MDDDDDDDDLAELESLSEESVLEHVRSRFYADNIYTLVGSILVAVNPFKSLGIYDNPHKPRREAHVYRTAMECYDAMLETKRSQSVLISGESGAGKTETCKHILAYVARGDASVEDQIIKSNPVLEAYGNAKTLRNNNSSRFGKWMRLDFSGRGVLGGGSVTNYLLEKSRVVACASGERNYHALYQLVVGARKERAALGPLPATPESFGCLMSGRCVTVEGLDDARDWTEQRRALDVLGVSVPEQSDAIAVLAAILWLMNCEFYGDDEGGGRAANVATTLAIAGPLVGVEADRLETALTTRTEQMGKGSMVTLPLSPSQAAAARNALAKHLYARLFDWLVARINRSLDSKTAAARPSTTTTTTHIGILDIFGFEVFATNSFEQLCINYANEKLQLVFNNVVFAQEVQTYEAEGVPSTALRFDDNAACVALLDGKPVNAFSLLDDECAGGAAARDDKYRSKCVRAFQGKNAHFSSSTHLYGFTVGHFAGHVEYDARGFVEKNRDALSTTLSTLFAVHSTLSFAASLFDDGAPPSPGVGKKKAAPAKKTLSAAFRAQLSGLVKALEATDPHFIRCIKSNAAKRPGCFEDTLCLEQLRYSGLFEAIRIRRAGYATRMSHTLFARRYAIVVSTAALGDRRRKRDAKRACETILADPRVAVACKDRSYVGTTQVFLKDAAVRRSLDALREEQAGERLKFAQAAWRGYTIREKSELAAHRRKRRLARRARAAAAFLQRCARGAAARRTTRAALGTLERLRGLTKSTRNRAALDGALIPLLGGGGPEADLSVALGPLWASASVDDLPLAPALRRRLGAHAAEVAVAVNHLRRLRLEASIDAEIAEATAARDVAWLGALIETAVALEIDVTAARADLATFLEREATLRDLKRFSEGGGNDEEEDRFAVFDRIHDLLEGGARLGLDDAVAAAKRTYEEVAPTLERRAALRRACETVDASVLLADSVEELGQEEDEMPDEWPEKKAAAELRRMLECEREICLRIDAQFDRQALTPREVELCRRVERAASARARADAENALRYAAGSAEVFDALCRAYKWRAVYCTWLPALDNAVFCGLHILRARERGEADSPSARRRRNEASRRPPVERTTTTTPRRPTAPSNPKPPPPPPPPLPPSPLLLLEEKQKKKTKNPPPAYAGVDATTLRRLEASRVARDREKARLARIDRELDTISRSVGRRRKQAWR